MTPQTAPQGARDLNRARILVVDDDPAIADALQRLLELEHDVVVETSSPRALARVKRGERFDVVLADLKMPDLSGVDLYTEIHNVDPQQAERTVFITGGDPAESDFLASLPNGWLEKPFAVGDLRRAIAGVLDTAARARAS